MLADRVLHTSTTTGTGTYDLIDPASPLYLSAVAAVGSGNRLTYAVEMGSAWEIGWGVVTAGSPATLTRNLIRSSTGALISWGAGTKTIYSVGQADLLRFGARGSLPSSGGTANAQTISHVTPMRDVYPGAEVVFVPGATNTGGTTLNVDGLSPLALLRPDGTACVGGEVLAGVPARAIYAPTAWRLTSYPASTTGAAIMRAADAAAARTALSVPPTPTTLAGSGNFVLVTPGGGNPIILPAGGTWALHAVRYDDNGSFDGNISCTAGIAGGSNVGGGLAGRYWVGWAWRIS